MADAVPTSKVGAPVAVARMPPGLGSAACRRARAPAGLHQGRSLQSDVRDHVSGGRKQDSRVWAWALAAVILVAALLVILPALGFRHVPAPLLEKFLEHSGPGGPAPK